MSDKRIYMRCKNMFDPISCSITDREGIEIEISDILCEGLGLNTNERLSRGDKIELELTVSEDNIPMFIEGEVAWAERNNGSNDMRKAGVRLEKINSLDKERLIRYLHSNLSGFSLYRA